MPNVFYKPKVLIIASPPYENYLNRYKMRKIGFDINGDCPLLSSSRRNYRSFVSKL